MSFAFEFFNPTTGRYPLWVFTFEFFKLTGSRYYLLQTFLLGFLLEFLKHVGEGSHPLIISDIEGGWCSGHPNEMSDT